MTLDEAIKHAEEVAKEQEELYLLCPIPSEMCDPNKDCALLKNGKNKGCIKCAEEHEQLAEWLKDYKRLKEQQPSDDCVSRQAVLERINDWWGITSTLGEPTLCDCIRELPPVAPTTCIAKVKFSKEDMQELVDEKIKDIVAERKKGHWEQYGDSWKEKYRCSECKEEQPKMLCGEQIIGFWSDYCPNCGAEMVGAENE